MKVKAILPLVLITALTSCSQKTVVLEDKIFCFDTYVESKLFEGNKTDISYIRDLFQEYDKLADNYQARDVTNVYTINNTNDSLQIDEKLYRLIGQSMDVRLEGASHFNILCGSLAKKWKEALKNQQILDENTIKEELSKIKNTYLISEGKDNFQRIGEAEIDLGGIVKGFVLDEVLEYLNQRKIKKYLINAGESSILLGEKQSKDGLFNVGIKDIPNAYLKLKNCFVSTSANSVQGVTIDGVKYSHIVDPITGSAINKHDTVIVVSDKGYYSDAMSTSFMMSKVEDIIKREEMSNIQTIVIENNKIVYCNENLKIYYH